MSISLHLLPDLSIYYLYEAMTTVLWSPLPPKVKPKLQSATPAAVAATPAATPAAVAR
jgi:hypothetical protein